MLIKTYDIKAKAIKGSEFAESKKIPKDNLFYILNRLYNMAALKSSHTKNRGERRGGGIKPWRQKGTGRARVGSNRSPIWRKGGVIFGPRKEQNFKRKINAKSKKIARDFILSQMAKDKAVIIWKINSKNFPVKTSEAEKMLLRLPLKTGSILFIKSKDEKCKALGNISYLTLKNSVSLSVKDLLRFDSVVITSSAFKEIIKKNEAKKN